MDVEAERRRLEHLELEAIDGRADDDTYVSLMLCYLLENDLCNAKFLWRRAPEQLRHETGTLWRLWSVGRSMWRSEWQQLYQQLADSSSWPAELHTRIQQLQDSVRERAVSLVARAYTTVSLASLQTLFGQSRDQCVETARARGWRVDGQFVLPTDAVKLTQPTDVTAGNSQSEHSANTLASVAEYVSFLET